MSEILNRKKIDKLVDKVIEIYQSDGIPWIVGYSGGKDSTAALQIVWKALVEMGVTHKNKTVHVITVDTMVESPVVSNWVNHSLNLMEIKAEELDLPIKIHKLQPKINDSYWVNLVGKGYPFPKTSFRWCTDRLKIKPTNHFVQEMIAVHGEVIMVMGTRKAESANRQQTLSRFEKLRTREYLNPSTTLTNAFIFPVLEDWSNDNVWQYLMMDENPWGNSNKDLLTMYRGATADGECPLVLDTNTPSCGNSRFGCWVCTLVEQDKSMNAMILNDAEKAWMLPLLQLRNEIGQMALENERRDFRRMDGNITLVGDKLVHGPYRKEVREEWLEKLLKIQEKIREEKTSGLDDFTLITMEELEQIRRIWLYEKHQFDDSLPVIYERATGRKYPGAENEHKIFGNDEWELLQALVTERYPDEQLLFELQASLLDLEVHSSDMRHRRGILNELETKIKKYFYKNEEDALVYAVKKQEYSLDENEDVKLSPEV